MIDLYVTDIKEKCRLIVSNGALIHRTGSKQGGRATVWYGRLLMLDVPVSAVAVVRHGKIWRHRE
jgi:hypothetical protein